MSETVEDRAYEQLERLHGATISKEMGGKTAIAQARVLCKVLDLPRGSITGKREGVVGMTRCVDLSGVLEDCEEF